MDIAVDRLEFAPPATPGLLRSLGLALLAHAFLIAALTWGVHWRREAVRVSVEAELWSALPQQAAPKLVAVAPEPPVAPPAPPPAPPQAQPQLPDVDIAMEREKLRLKKEKNKQQELQKQQELEKQRLERQRLEKLKQEKLALEKKRLQDKHELDKKVAENKKRQEQEAKMSEARQKDQVNRALSQAGASGAPSATGSALKSSGPSAGYAGRIRARIKPNIVFTDTISGNPVAEVEVQTAPDGTIVSRKLTQASGVKSWDEAVLKAIDKTEVLPRDLDSRVPPVLTISFRPKD